MVARTEVKCLPGLIGLAGLLGLSGCAGLGKIPCNHERTIYALGMVTTNQAAILTKITERRMCDAANTDDLGGNGPNPDSTD